MSRWRSSVGGAIAATVTLVLIACGGTGGASHPDTGQANGGGQTPGGSIAPSPASPAGPGGVAAAPDTACRAQGDWRVCSLRKRLESAGLIPVPDSTPVRHPFLSVPGTAYSLGRAGRLEVFVYPSRQARERDSSKLDSATAAPRGTAVDWPVPPTLLLNNNLLAILLAQNERLIERVGLAVTAGLPAADAAPTTLKGVAIKSKPR